MHTSEIENLLNPDYNPKNYIPQKKRRVENAELNKFGREYFLRYAQNFKMYIDKIGNKIYTQKAEELGGKPQYSVVNNLIAGRSNYIMPIHYIQCSYISKLPIGMWLNADMKFYEENLMIRFVRAQAEAEINANYVTDGVFLFGKNLATPVPLGTSFQKEIDYSYDTRSYIRK